MRFNPLLTGHRSRAVGKSYKPQATIRYMTSRSRALLNVLLVASPLIIGFSYATYVGMPYPDRVILPTIAGLVMNLGFWAFHEHTIAPIHELENVPIGTGKKDFLLMCLVHVVAILLLLTVDLSALWAALPSF